METIVGDTSQDISRAILSLYIISIHSGLVTVTK